MRTTSRQVSMGMTLNNLVAMSRIAVVSNASNSGDVGPRSRKLTPYSGASTTAWVYRASVAGRVPLRASTSLTRLTSASKLSLMNWTSRRSTAAVSSSLRMRSINALRTR